MVTTVQPLQNSAYQPAVLDSNHSKSTNTYKLGLSNGRAMLLVKPEINSYFHNATDKAVHSRQTSVEANKATELLKTTSKQAKKLFCRQGLVSPIFIIKKLAKKHHAVEYTRFSQGGYIGDVPFGRGGICTALVMKWFSSLSKNISFLQDIGPYYSELKKPIADGREEVFQLAINYYTDIYAGDPGKADASWNTEAAPDKNVLADYLSDYGIVDRGFILREDKMDVEKLASSLTQPGYYDIGIFMAEGGGHALGAAITATELNQNEYRLFDPNYGELVFQDQQSFQAAVKEYIARVYPNHVGKYRVQHFNL